MELNEEIRFLLHNMKEKVTGISYGIDFLREIDSKTDTEYIKEIISDMNICHNQFAELLESLKKFFPD